MVKTIKKKVTLKEMNGGKIMIKKVIKFIPKILMDMKSGKNMIKKVI